MVRITTAGALVALMLGSGGAALAKPYFSPLVPLPPFTSAAEQAAPPPAAPKPAVPAAQATKPDCVSTKSVAEPATTPQPGAKDGTAPGNDGSTGWSGGTGGSQIGTSPQGAAPESKTWQPPTARGLDLKGAPDAVVQPAKC